MNSKPTLTKQRLVRQIGIETGLRDVDVAAMLESFIALISTQIAQGGRTEIQNFLVLEVQTRTRQFGQTYQCLKVRPGKHIRALLKAQTK